MEGLAGGEAEERSEEMCRQSICCFKVLSPFHLFLRPIILMPLRSHAVRWSALRDRGAQTVGWVEGMDRGRLLRNVLDTRAQGLCQRQAPK